MVAGNVISLSILDPVVPTAVGFTGRFVLDELNV